MVHEVKIKANMGITPANVLYLQTVGFFCRRITPDVSGVDVVTTLLLSLESVIGTVLTGTETNEVTNTTCHINAGKITGQAMQPQSYTLHS
jgi:hypothetical protein